jgi:hypothetical protein
MIETKTTKKESSSKIRIISDNFLKLSYKLYISAFNSLSDYNQCKESTILARFERHSGQKRVPLQRSTYTISRVRREGIIEIQVRVDALSLFKALEDHQKTFRA